MHLIKAAFAGLFFSTTALSTPSPTVKSMMHDAPQWTIHGLVRTCNARDTSCEWCFTIDTNERGHSPTYCAFTVHAASGQPASRSPADARCGAFTVTSGWSGQFGPDKGFTTLSVIDYSRKLIVWPAYTDKQLCEGKVVVPDQCYAPVCLP